MMATRLGRSLLICTHPPNIGLLRCISHTGKVELIHSQTHTYDRPQSRYLSTRNSKAANLHQTTEFSKKFFTIPNVLTLSRMATSPAIGFFILNGMHSHALACFAFAASTDLLDGFIARRFNQQSDAGVMLDPLADKLLMTTCFITMCNTGLMPYWLVKGFILRDFMILLGASVIRYNGFPEKPSFSKFFNFKKYPTLGFEPTLVSKINTALQCTLIVVHLSTSHMIGSPLYDQSIYCLQLLTGFTTATSLVQYITRVGGVQTRFYQTPARRHG